MMEFPYLIGLDSVVCAEIDAIPVGTLEWEIPLDTQDCDLYELNRSIYCKADAAIDIRFKLEIDRLMFRIKFGV